MIRHAIMGVSAVLGSAWAPIDDAGPGARELFLHELASRLGELRWELDGFFTEPISPCSRDMLSGKLRSLAAEAISLDDPTLAEELSACEAVVQSTGVLGRLEALDRQQLLESLDRIESFLKEELAREQTPPSLPVRDRLAQQRHEPPPELLVASVVLIVGPAVLAKSLEDAVADAEQISQFEIELADNSEDARELVRALAPDIIVIDTDIDGALCLVEELVNDTLTDSIPMIALGSWDAPEQAAPFIALGVARHFTKPVAPGALQRVLLELAPDSSGSRFERVGRGTLDELGARLADELQRGLCDAANEDARVNEVDLGDGSEILATLWNAVGRIRELVTAKTQGEIRFAPVGPEQAVTGTSWLSGGHRADVVARAPKLSEVRRLSEDQTLDQLDVLVVDEDLSNNWFLCGLLREAGARIHDAFGGRKALVEAYERPPNLVISDVALNGFDGVSLCRAFKQDIVLSSVPVLLMAAKDDVLQSARELGATADGYLRKDASADVILQRVLEVTQPRRRLSERIAQCGPVRGRLDGLTTYDLLAIACRLRPESCLTIRDAVTVYEITIRGGRPTVFTQTSHDGNTRRGAPALLALMGLRSGRFIIDDLEDVDDAQLCLRGSFAEQLRKPVARIRAAQGVLTGRCLLGVQRVEFAADVLRPLTTSMPPSARQVLEALLAGASPSALISSGRAPAELVETVLRDAAQRGAVLRVYTDGDRDVLADAVERHRLLIMGSADEDAIIEAHGGMLLASDPLTLEEGISECELETSVAGKGHGLEQSVESLASDQAVDVLPVVAVGRSAASRVEVDALRTATASVSTASTGSDTVIPMQGALARAEQSLPLAAPHNHTPILASARVSQASSSDHTPIFSSATMDASVPRFTSTDDELGKSAGVGASSLRPDSAIQQRPDTLAASGPKVPRVPKPSAYVSHAPRGRASNSKSGSRYLLPLLFGLLGICIAIGMRWARENSSVEPPKPLPAPAVPAVTAPAVTPAAPVEEKSTKASVEEFELTAKEQSKLSKNQGLLEVVAGRDSKIFVNGKPSGKGPVVKLPLEVQDKPYEVRVKLRGEERVRYATVKLGKRVRLRVAPPWSH